MQIVIDIPDQMYQKIKETNMVISGRRSGRSFDYILFNAVNTGTPLPKGHGKLVDIGQCDRKLFYQQCGGADSFITVKSAFDMLLSLPTIIEANRE